MHLSFKTVPSDSIITSVGASGYKALTSPCEVKIGKLTLLAGANSSGKSSIMQPLLLLKQTLEATTDPGTLQIDGPNIFFTSARDQMFSRRVDGSQARSCTFMFGLDNRIQFSLGFGSLSGKIALRKMSAISQGIPAITLTPNMTKLEIKRAIPQQFDEVEKSIVTMENEKLKQRIGFSVRRDRCLLYLQYGITRTRRQEFEFGVAIHDLFPSDSLASALKRCIHVPAFRSISERVYSLNESGSLYPGEFDDYTGSVLSSWQQHKSKNIDLISGDLRSLGLASRLSVESINDVNAEVYVDLFSSSNRSGKRLMVNIADVGFGVSQVLPVLVALRAATPKHLLYMEEPESHLHPQAQFALAEIVVGAIRRGVRVVIETHSSVFLLGIQAAIAAEKLRSSDVSFYWFRRSEAGVRVSEATIEADGSYGDWPVDFDEVLFGAQESYLAAVSKRK